jgi:hypothetical protein
MGTSLYSQVSSGGKPANCGALRWADECVRPYAGFTRGAGENRIIPIESPAPCYGFLTIHRHQL